jgi:hypothetical protein
MEERIRLIQHGGKSVILVDANKCTAEEATKVFVDERAVVAACAPKSALTLTDVTDTMFDNATIDAIKETIRLNGPHVRAAAVVGVLGLKKIILTALTTLTGRSLKLFDTREEALDWLVKQ